MNRQIKFRGKRLSDGKWIYGNYASVMFSEADNDTINGFPVDSSTAGQCVGLKDKNDNEIYEGDILHIKSYRNDFFKDSMDFRDAFDIDELKGDLEEEFTAEVVFEEGAFFCGKLYLDALFGNQKHSQPIHEFEVIGNVFDNPKLINR